MSEPGPEIRNEWRIEGKPTGMLKCKLAGLVWALLGVAFVAPVFAADEAPPRSYQWPWWGDMHWPMFGWIFPLICFAMMIVMLVFMLRGGAMGCMGHRGSADKPGSRDSNKRSGSGEFESALEILNERYARGEIGKEEYEEKKAAIASSR